MIQVRVVLSAMCLLCCTTQSDAASMYEVVVLNEPLRAEGSVITVDMDSRQQISTPLPDFRAGGALISAGSGREVFVLGIGTAPPVEIARLDLKTMEWEKTDYLGGFLGPNDMDWLPDGRFVFADEGGLEQLDPDVGYMESLVPPTELQFDQVEPLHVAVDSTGNIVTGDIVNGPYELIRKQPGTEGVERFEPGVFFADIAFDASDSLLGVGKGSLYRYDFNTRQLQQLFEHNALAGTGRIALDPDGRVVGLSQSPEDQRERLVRIDLEEGTVDVFALSTSNAMDMDIVIIPEPCGRALLLAGFLVIAAAWPAQCRVRRPRARG